MTNSKMHTKLLNSNASTKAHTSNIAIQRTQWHGGKVYLLIYICWKTKKTKKWIKPWIYFINTVNWQTL